MKTHNIEDIVNARVGSQVDIRGWIKSKRMSKGIIFYSVVDSTGEIQAVLNKKRVTSEIYETMSEIPPESAVIIKGTKTKGSDGFEIAISYVDEVGKCRKQLSPRPREYFNIHDARYANHILRNRASYLRNPRLSSVLKFKSNLLFELHKYFYERRYVLVDAPILTQLLLYDDMTAFQLEYNDAKHKSEKVWLSQCCTFQLEAAIHAFEKVYNITPSFRAEHSKSNRHLREYWHLKAEIAWANLDDLVKIAEDMLYTVVGNAVASSERELETLGSEVDIEKFKPPYKVIPYDDVVRIIHDEGNSFKWGKSLSTSDEKILTKKTGNKLIWVYGVPCYAEGFPFARDPDNPLITRTCDLITPYGFGELLGAAEKISNKEELLKRMEEKGKTSPDQLRRYQWYIDLRDQGMPPHGGIGMGIERVVRYVLRLPHIRDTISFPRLYGRIPNP